MLDVAVIFSLSLLIAIQLFINFISSFYISSNTAIKLHKTFILDNLKSCKEFSHNLFKKK